MSTRSGAMGETADPGATVTVEISASATADDRGVIVDRYGTDRA